MDGFKKSVVWLLAALSIAVFAFCFFGVNTYYGDVTTVVVKNAVDVETGNELGRTVRMTLAAPSGETMSDEQLFAARDAVKQRMRQLDVAEFDVTVDADARTVVVDMPYTAQAVSAAQNLGVQGDFVARKGLEETENSVLFTASDVKRATSTTNSIYGLVIYSLTLNLDPDAAKALQAATEELAEEYASSETAQNISFWYGGQMIGQISIHEAIRNGRVDFNTYSIDESTFTQLMCVLNSDPMPMSLSTSSAVMFNEQNDLLQAAYIALGCAFLLAALYLAFRYRLTALVGAVCTVGTMGLTFAVITGFMTEGGLAMTMPAFLAVTVLVLLCLYITAADGAAIKQSLAERSAAKGVQEGLKRNLGLTMRMQFTAMIVGLVLMGFQRHGLFYSFTAERIESYGVNVSFLTGAGTFGAILFWGCLISIAFNVLFSRLMLHSVLSYSGLRKAACFGGKTDA